MENFFVTIEFWANVIKNLKRVKQDGQIVKVIDYWLDFYTWKNLTRYNKIAPRKIFRDRLNTDLTWKLVEIREINERLTLEEW